MYKKWNLKNETIKCCENGVVLLWNIFKIFQLTIFKRFNVDINNYPTLSLLTFAIFRVNYLKEYTISCIGKNIKKIIQEIV